jgi:hypothetical protein
MRARGAPGTKNGGEWPEAPIVQGEPLRPIRTVERVLTRPDGTQVVVCVPVYPCFRLETWPPNAEEARHLGAQRSQPARSAEVDDLDAEDDAA